jgi:hypothetical protein
MKGIVLCGLLYYEAVVKPWLNSPEALDTVYM